MALNKTSVFLKLFRLFIIMNERRKHTNNADHSNYKNFHELIKIKIKIAKNGWLRQKCIKIEQLQSKHDHLNLHKKLKETAGFFRRWKPSLRVN